jgi:hypothetical protein
MALTFDYTRVADSDTLHENKRGLTKTEYLCWALMDARIGEVTESNWLDVWTRIEMLEKLNGSYLLDSNGAMPYTAEDIHRRIGYSCNVKTETFRARLHKSYEIRLQDNKRANLIKEEVTA